MNTRTPDDPPAGHEPEWGPALNGGGPTRRRRRGRSGLRRVGVLLLVVLLVLVGWGAALAWHLDNSVERVEVTAVTPRGGARINVLVVGSDSRADLTDQERAELTTGNVEGERTDTIMILSVRGSEASLTAFPRDLWVTRCDGSQGRINAAHGIGGPSCLVDTIEGLSDVPIHHYAEVDFGGFRSMVDAVGGVDLCVDQDIVDPLAGLNLDSGCQTLDGAQALGYVRTRSLDNDLGRIGRQQEFLAALAEQAATKDTLLNPVRSWNTTGSAGAALRADPDLGPVTFARLAWGLRPKSRGSLAATEIVPATPARINGAAVLEPDLVAAEELFVPLRTDAGTVDRAASPAPVDLPSASEVTVTVLNGGDVPGLAAATADELTPLGYQVTEVGNTSDRPTTIVASPEGEGAARRLAADLPVPATIDLGGAVDGHAPRDNAVVLVLGSDLDESDLATGWAAD